MSNHYMLSEMLTFEMWAFLFKLNSSILTAEQTNDIIEVKK